VDRRNRNVDEKRPSTFWGSKNVCGGTEKKKKKPGKRGTGNFEKQKEKGKERGSRHSMKRERDDFEKKPGHGHE